MIDAKLVGHGALLAGKRERSLALTTPSPEIDVKRSEPTLLLTMVDVYSYFLPEDCEDCVPRQIMAFLIVTLMALLISEPSYAEDRHAGYYYPEPASTEVYKSEVPNLPGTNRDRRIGFVVTVANGMQERPYAPRFAFFAKGEKAEKLLIVALEDNVLDTLYRARAHLAALTSLARATPIFKQVGPAELNFFDLLKMLGFEQLTISDGDEFAHQVKVE